MSLRLLPQNTFRSAASLTCSVTVPTAVALAVFVSTGPALAIPSPELVIGSLSSISQLVALVSAMLGGGAAIVGVRASKKRGDSGNRAQWAWPIVAILAVFCAASIAVNVHQYTEHRGERLARLEATLLRPAREPGVPKLDPTLKELSFSQQLKHPMGISTAEADQLLAAMTRGKRTDVVFLDVRESAESEMGNLPGATAVRYPDLSTAKLNLAGKKVILFCHNGNRSHETCETLAAQGIPCQFIVGGLEKWVVENRPLTGFKTRTLSELRAIPAYRNQRVLLDTPSVHDLVRNEGAIFVDVRYPGEFAARHLPGAISLPIRRLPTEELKSGIRELPKRPIILPCYDRRGCFFSEVLGLELTRAGHDLRGRYTVPFEYFVSSGRPPHVEQWLAETQRSLWSKATDVVAGLVSSLAGKVGLVLAIVFAALVSRLLVLPLSLKAERDQVRATALSGHMAALKARLKHDPQRLARAIRAIYRRHGLTPVRNLLALLFLPVMALAVVGVQRAAATRTEALLWVPNLAERDAFLLLPTMFGALIALYLHLTIAQTQRQRLWAWVLGLPLMTAAGALLSAAADLYLIVSAALLLAQRAMVVGQFGVVVRSCQTLGWSWRGLLGPAGIVRLRQVDRLAGCGNKAYRLAQLKAHGIDVPDGLVLTSRFLKRFQRGGATWRRRCLDRLWRDLGCEQIAVRSSAGAEDGSTNSFAGVFDTVLDVDRAGLEAAIVKVIASFEASRAASYGVEAMGGNILLQRMVEAEFAGVFFTRDPAAAGLALIELVPGTAEGLVSGAVAPDAFRFGRLSNKPIGKAEAPIDLKPLLMIGRRAEELFGAPQDIEWAYRGGCFHIVQSRNITHLSHDRGPDAVVQGEWLRVLGLAAGAPAHEVVFAQNEMAEMLPRPTPLSLSLMESLWSSGGSVDLACRDLGLEYRVEEDAPSYLLTVVGRLYVDKRQERARSPRLGPVSVRRLEKSADRIEREFREGFLPRFLEDVRLLEAVDFNRLPTPDLYAAIERARDNFVRHTHVEVDIVNIAANFYLERAKAELEEHGLDTAICLARVPQSAPACALAEAIRSSGEARRNILRASFGHRALLDYELAQPRYGEDDGALDALCGVDTPSATHEQDTGAENPALVAAGRPVLATVDRARRFQALKEDAKHHSLRELAVMRQAVLALDRRLDLEGLAFYLTVDELIGVRDQSALGLRTIASRRRQEAELLADVAPLSSTLTVPQLESASFNLREEEQASDGNMRGTRVSGSRVVEGRARVVTRADAERGASIEGFQQGDIIVSSMCHPAWLRYLGSAGGIVCEVGGWLSHMALLAREYDVPMIVGTRGLAAIPDGGLLRLQKDGGVEIISRAQTQVVFAQAAE